MNRIERQAQKIAEKIKQAGDHGGQIIATYHVSDQSVQAELRLRATWEIRVPVDAINYPRDLSGGQSHNADLCMHRLDVEISRAARLAVTPITPLTIIAISERTKTGPERRAEAKNLWLIEQGKRFLAAYRTATTKRNLAAIRKQITALQAQQKALLPAIRESSCSSS